MLEKLDHKNIFQAVRQSSSNKKYTISLIQQLDRTLAIDNLAKPKTLNEALITFFYLSINYSSI